ncbi:MAG: heme-binding protein [Gammaproteobacteria bacterium]
MKYFRTSLITLTIVLSASTAGAQSSPGAAGAQPEPAAAAPPPPPAPGPSLELASQAAKVAIEACTAKGFAVGVTVVDSGGVPKVLLAQDGASTRGVQSSTNKAVTALNFKDATSHLGERVKTDTALAQSVSANPNFNVRAGGVLLKVKDRIVGAIGVGGARGSENDEACALAGLQAIQERLNAQIAAR